MTRHYQTLSEFYPFYLTEHQNKTSRRLHFIGTGIVILVFIYALLTGQFSLLLALPLAGYGFAWAGHFFFEKNRPATFQYPLFSLASDFIMFKDTLTGQIDAKVAAAVREIEGD